MAEIIIEKRVTLEFLGEKYKDSYLVFKSIAVRNFPKLVKNLNDADKSGTEQAQIDAMLEVLESHFVSGLFDGQKVAKEDIGEFDQATITRAFEVLTGQDFTAEVPFDPKDETTLTTPSGTDSQSQ